MKRLIPAAVLLAASAVIPAPARAKPPASLWRAPEPVLFTCDLGNKTVSICSEEQGGAVAVQQVGPQGDLSNAANDRKLINQLYAVRNAYVDKLGQPDLEKTLCRRAA